MSFFGKNWASEIALECKRIFNINHDATEQEIHEKLRAVESHEDLTTQIRNEIAAENSGPTELETRLQSENEALQNRVNELQSEKDSLAASLRDSNEGLKAANAQITSLGEEIEELKKQPAEQHTGGATVPAVKEESETPVWDKVKAQIGL